MSNRAADKEKRRVKSGVYELKCDICGESIFKPGVYVKNQSRRCANPKCIEENRKISKERNRERMRIYERDYRVRLKLIGRKRQPSRKEYALEINRRKRGTYDRRCVFCNGQLFKPGVPASGGIKICGSEDCAAKLAEKRKEDRRDHYRRNADKIRAINNAHGKRKYHSDPEAGRLASRAKRERVPPEKKRKYALKHHRRKKAESIEMQFILNPIMEKPDEAGTNQPE